MNYNNSLKYIFAGTALMSLVSGHFSERKHNEYNSFKEFENKNSIISERVEKYKTIKDLSSALFVTGLAGFLLTDVIGRSTKKQ